MGQLHGVGWRGSSRVAPLNDVEPRIVCGRHRSQVADAVIEALPRLSHRRDLSRPGDLDVPYVGLKDYLTLRHMNVTGTREEIKRLQRYCPTSIITMLREEKRLIRSGLIAYFHMGMASLCKQHRKL